MELLTKHSDNDAIIDRLTNGDVIAFEFVVREYSGDLLRYAGKLTNDTQQASDLVQDVFVDLWVRHSKLGNINSLQNYLFGMLRHRFFRLVSRNKLHDLTMSHLSERMEHFQYSILDVMAAADLEQTLSSILHQLPENMQRIFQLRDEDYTLREIADALGLAEQTVKSYNADLNRRIKEALLTKHPDISHSLLAVVIVELLKT